MRGGHGAALQTCFDDDSADREGGDDPVPRAESQPCRRLVRWCLAQDQAAAGDGAEQVAVACRVGAVDPAGQDGDRRSYVGDGERASVGGGVDAVRSLDPSPMLYCVTLKPSIQALPIRWRRVGEADSPNRSRAAKIPAMANRRGGGLLTQIEAGVADHRVPLSSLLQNCIGLGRQAGSEKLRNWARQELHGYAGADTVPDYRHVPAALMALIINRAGYNGVARRFDDSVFPAQIREIIREKVDLEEAILSQGIGQLEAMASEETQDHQLIPPWAGFIANTMNQHNMVANGRVAEVYLSVPNVAIHDVLVRIRTALAELVAELIMLTPEDQEVPDRAAADQAVQLVVTGEGPVINYTVQQAADGGTNVTVNSESAAGPVTVSGANGSAIGSQTASGANSSVVGSQAASGTGSVAGQAVQAGRDAISAGQDATITGAGDQPVKEGWWARLRKRGAVVAFATIITAIAGVAAVIVAILIAAGWKP